MAGGKGWLSRLKRNGTRFDEAFLGVRDGHLDGAQGHAVYRK